MPVEVTDAAAAVIKRLGPGISADLVWTNPVGSHTYRLSGDETTQFLKLSPAGGPGSHDILAEAERLTWVGSRVSVPTVLETGREQYVSWMRTEGLPGTAASDRRWRSDPKRTARHLGRAVRSFHDGLSGAVNECPWSGRIADRLALAPESVDALALMADAPEERDLVVAHGDFCLPNVLLREDGSVAGFVDLGALGVADRAADLGCHVWSLEYNRLGAAVEEFLAAYDYPVDRAAVRWYRDFYTAV